MTTPSSYVVWMLPLALLLYGAGMVTRSLGAPRRWAFERLAAFLVGMSVLLVVMEPVHFTTPTGYAEVVAAWRATVPLVAMLAAASGLLGGLSGAGGGALAVSGPAAAYAAFAWAAYVWLDGLVPPDDQTMRDELARYATPLLSLVTAFPGVAFAASVAAGALAQVLRAGVRTPPPRPGA